MIVKIAAVIMMIMMMMMSMLVQLSQISYEVRSKGIRWKCQTIDSSRILSQYGVEQCNAILLYILVLFYAMLNDMIMRCEVLL
jgi:hypothetical protein